MVHVRPGRLESLRNEPRAAEKAWLTEDDIAERLRRLRADHSAWRAPSDTGQFVNLASLGRNRRPPTHSRKTNRAFSSGRVPTTQILQPPTGEWDAHAKNEFCLLLARKLGLVVPNSAIERFRYESRSLLSGFDRIRSNRRWLRVHQEDMCQANATHPAANTKTNAALESAPSSIYWETIRADHREGTPAISPMTIRSDPKPLYAAQIPDRVRSLFIRVSIGNPRQPAMLS